jgi:transketolase
VDVFTHDSIAVGEDGPTHQPVEHLASLRAIPGLIILRPADAAEVLEAWKVIMQFRHEPVAFDLDPTGSTNVGPHQVCIGRRAAPGAYVLADPSDGNPDVLLLATGSEVAFCVESQLEADGIKTRVVSMPSGEMFEYHCSKNPEYRDSVLPLGAVRGDRWSDSGNEDIRRIRASQRVAAEIRFHGGAGHGGRAGAAEPSLVEGPLP